MIAFDAMLALARLVGQTADCVAQAGSGATTLIDAVLLGTTLDKVGRTDDEYNGGTAFITYDAAGASAAPENETARITDYAATTGTLTLATSDLSAAAATGDHFTITSIRRDILFRAVNNALMSLGDVPFEDDTSLDTVAGTLAYTIPAAAKHDLREVYIAESTSSPYYWKAWNYWHQLYNKSTYDLEFTVMPAASRDIRLVYMAPHGMLENDSDAINNCVPQPLLVWQAAYQYYRDLLNTQEGRDNKTWEALGTEAAQRAELYRSKYPIFRPARQVKLGPAGQEPGYKRRNIDTADVATS